MSNETCRPGLTAEENALLTKRREEIRRCFEGTDASVITIENLIQDIENRVVDLLEVDAVEIAKRGNLSPNEYPMHIFSVPVASTWFTNATPYEIIFQLASKLKNILKEIYREIAMKRYNERIRKNT